VKKRVNVENLWGNLPLRLSQGMNTNLLVITILLAIGFPALIIAKFRFDVNVDFFVEAMLWGSFGLGIIYAKNFKTNKRHTITSNDGIVAKLKVVQNIILYYMLIPFVFDFLIVPLSMTPVVKLLSEKNPQHLSTVVPTALIGDLISSIQAGAEEIWRIALISTLLLLVKALVGKVWNNKTFRWVTLVIVVLTSSFVFGWLHTFGYTKTQWLNLDITMLLGTSGLLYAILLLVTRRIGTVIIAHMMWDVTNTMLRANVDSFYTLMTLSFAFAAILYLVAMLYIDQKTKSSLNMNNAQ
jgi:hypothetical protein